ncbi:MAG: NUDIX domain-containing protein [Pseudomonadota bacterium]
MRRVACPIVRQGGRVLAFRHPWAGLQLVKGGIERGERPDRAALRELWEEAGVTGWAPRALGRLRTGGLHWHLFAVRTGPLPWRWTHRCADDGGQDFAFFWHDPARAAGFHPIFRPVLRRLAR